MTLSCHGFAVRIGLNGGPKQPMQKQKSPQKMQAAWVPVKRADAAHRGKKYRAFATKKSDIFSVVAGKPRTGERNLSYTQSLGSNKFLAEFLASKEGKGILQKPKTHRDGTGKFMAEQKNSGMEFTMSL